MVNARKLVLLVVLAAGACNRNPGLQSPTSPDSPGSPSPSPERVNLTGTWTGSLTDNGKAQNSATLLLHFARHPGRVFTRAQLLDQVWGDHVFVEERTVDVHIRRLRKALEPSRHDALIQTVRSAGYRFSAA